MSRWDTVHNNKWYEYETMLQILSRCIYNKSGIKKNKSDIKNKRYEQ